MLRASSQKHAETVDLNAVMTGSFAGDVKHGDALVAFAEAVVAAVPQELQLARASLVAAAGPEVMIDAAGVASNFQRMERIADSTGITLGHFEQATTDLREELAINSFATHRQAHAS